MTKWAVYKLGKFSGNVWACDEADAKEKAVLEFGLGSYDVERVS